MAKRVTRGRPSRIEQLPAALKNTLDRLLREGVSQAEVLRRLNVDVTAADLPPLSRSGINRYTTGVAEMGQEVREIRAAADALVAKFGEQPTGEVGQLTVEILRTMSVKVALRARQLNLDDAGELAEMTGLINELALATERLERAAALGRKRESDMRRAVAQEAEREAKRQGLSADRAADLRRALAMAP